MGLRLNKIVDRCTLLCYHIYVAYGGSKNNDAVVAERQTR